MSFTGTYEALLRDASLFDEWNFAERFFAIEFLEGVVGDVRRLVEGDRGHADGFVDLRPEGVDFREIDNDEARAARLLAALMEVDDRLFARLRTEIAAGRHRGLAFRGLLQEYCGTVVADGPGYDVLDVFVNGLCSYLPMPSPVRLLEPEMVDFHKTPARVVLEVARWVGPGDVFVDLGAGLGQVVVLVHLLTGASARGLEIEPAFCAYARACAAGLGLDVASGAQGELGAAARLGSAGVDLIEGDARFARYDEGTVFFLYTPFTGELLATVFELLQRESLVRTFTVVTYGPCTKQAARQSWLRAVDVAVVAGGDGPCGSGDPADAEGDHTLCLFRAGAFPAAVNL